MRDKQRFAILSQIADIDEAIQSMEKLKVVLLSLRKDLKNRVLEKRCIIRDTDRPLEHTQD